MSKPNSKTLKLLLALAAAMLAVSISSGWRPLRVSAARQDLPPGNGVELANAKCVTCHEADLIMAQRLGKPGWTREVEKMIRWGAKVTDAEKEPLVDYLVKSYGPRPLK
jgi:cytochrome c5